MHLEWLLGEVHLQGIHFGATLTWFNFLKEGGHGKFFYQFNMFNEWLDNQLCSF